MSPLICYVRRRPARFGAPAAATTALVAMFLLVPPAITPLVAWGAQGHHIVARLAWALMTPPTRTDVTTLLGGGQDVFVSSSTWADEVRSSRPETANWHFVDIPVDQAHYSAARDCQPSPHGDCVIAEIARARAELADPARPENLKAESLKFLVHFVGDLHQPLHTIDDHDRGGNDVRVVALRGGAGRATNLHAVWDTGLINLANESEAAQAGRLLADLNAHPVDTHVDIVQWAEESHAVALNVSYRYPGFSPTGPPPEPVTLDADYRFAALVAIDHQLERAGARLAVLLNQTFSR